MRHLLFAVLAAPILFAAADGTPPPEGIDVGTKITKVTVYSDRARVTRSGPVALKEGRQRVLISGLPNELDSDSVSAALPGKHGAKILSIEVEQAFGKRVEKKEAEALLAKAKDQRQKLSAIDDELGALAAEEQYLRSLTVKPKPNDKGQPQPVTLEPAAWQETLRFATEGLTAVLARTRTKQAERRQLTREIQANDVEIRKFQSYERVAVKRVALEVESARAETVTAEVTYAIAGPTWRPSYAVRVLSTQGKVELVTHGVVRQSTGEDWEDVDLVLSTAFPQGGADIPELLAWRLGDEQQYAYAAATGGVGNMSPGLASKPQPAPPARTTVATADKSKKSEDRRRAPAAPKASYAPAPEPAPMYEAEEADVLSESASYAGDDFGYAESTVRGDTGGAGYGAALSGGMPAPPPPPPPAARPAATPMPVPQIRAVGKGLWSLPAGRAYTFVNHENDGFSWSGDVLYCPSPRRSSGGFDYTFKADRKRTVPADGKEQKIKVASATFPAKLLYEVVAPISTKAWLRTTVKNDTRQPFLAGEAFIFLDEDFVGRSFLATVAPSAELQLSLGVDEDVKVERNVEQKAETTGLIGKKDRTAYTVTVDVKSYKKRAIEVLVRDQVPITWQKDDISIETVSLTPDPEKTEQQERAGGLYSWRLQLAAGGKEKIKLKYVVEHPRDFDLVERRGN